MSMQRSAVLTAKFANLVVKETKIPTPGPNEILVQVHSAAVNPVDYKIQKAGRFFETFPRVLGGDAAGTVESVGDGVKNFKQGDKVFTFVPSLGRKEASTEVGAFQQYTLTGDAAIGIVPDDISFDAASTIPLAFSTAADGFYNFLGLDRPTSSTAQPKEDFVLVWGGASSVGQFAIQLAKQAGYKVVTAASKSGHAALRKLGADVTLDYHDQDISEQIVKATDGKLTRVYDAVAIASSVKAILPTLPKGGKVAFTQMTPETANVTYPDNIEWTRVFAGTLYTSHKDLGREMFEWASAALKDGRLLPNPVELRSGGLDGLQETFDFYEKNGIQGKKFVFNP